MAKGFYYKCNDCGKEFDESALIYLCPVCSKNQDKLLPPKGVLKICYNYDAIAADGYGILNLLEMDYLPLLPIGSESSLAPLKIGDTPLYHKTKIDGDTLAFNLYLKDDSQNPSYSFKDRASTLVSAYAKEQKIDKIVVASTGNAGSSLAAICAAQEQKAIVLVPETAPLAKISQVVMYGATLVPVKGTYDDAFDLSIRISDEFGWYNRNTAYNPLTIEGKKTVSFELFEQLNGRVPDRIFVPVGDGVIISAVFKGFEDLLLLGIIDRMPIIVAIQSKKSDNLVRNLNVEDFEVRRSKTLADSISVDVPRNFYMTRDYIRKYKGENLVVSDKVILDASSILSRNYGLFAEPAAAAAFAGFLVYKNKDKLEKDSDNVVLLTGSGLKDLKALKNRIKLPESINPDLEHFKKNVHDQL